MRDIPGEKEVVQGVFFFCNFMYKYLKYFPYPLSINRMFL